MTTRIPLGAEEISRTGFNRHIGPLYRLADPDSHRFAFVVEDKHMNAGGSVHGGMLMALADVAMSRTARLVANAVSCSTVSLSCDFLAPGSLGDLIEARARVIRLTKTMAFLSAEISESGRPLLVASGVWKLRRAE